MNWTGDGLLRHVVWDQGGQARKRGHAGATGRVGSAVLPLPLVQYGGTEGTKEGDKKPRESAEFEAWSASPLGDASQISFDWSFSGARGDGEVAPIVVVGQSVSKERKPFYQPIV
jgi:hypothetical protein